jgi:hypothetical protein
VGKARGTDRAARHVAAFNDAVDDTMEITSVAKPG